MPTSRSTDRKTPDLAIAAIARRQHGAWSTVQARRAGLTATMVTTRVAKGAWIRLERGVFADVTSLPTWHRGVMAAVLAEPWALASHRSAGVLHQIEGIRPGRPEITVRPGANARGTLALAHRGVEVQATRVDGIPCSTLAQTFVDLAQVVSPGVLRRGLDQKVASRPTVLDAIRERYVELAPRGGRNLRPLKAALLRFDDGTAPSESALESALRDVLDHPAVPLIQWQAPFPGRVVGQLRVDAVIPSWRLIIEVDGRAWHARVDDFDRDRRRDADAAVAGYQTLRFSWTQVTRAPAWTRSAVLAVGAHRAA